MQCARCGWATCCNLVIEDERGAADLAYFLETSPDRGGEAGGHHPAVRPVRAAGQLHRAQPRPGGSAIAWWPARRRQTPLNPPPGCCRAGGCSTTRSTKTWRTSASPSWPGCRSASSTTSIPPSRRPAPSSRSRRGGGRAGGVRGGVEAVPRSAAMLRSAKRGMVAEEARSAGAGGVQRRRSRRLHDRNCHGPGAGRVLQLRRGESGDGAPGPVGDGAHPADRAAVPQGAHLQRFKHPRHPVITMRFTNETGLTLGAGRSRWWRRSEYAGEAMLPFTAPGGELFLAYAVDLGIAVTETPEVEAAWPRWRSRTGCWSSRSGTCSRSPIASRTGTMHLRP